MGLFNIVSEAGDKLWGSVAASAEKKIVLLLATLLLAGCATPRQQSELDKLHNQVGQLNNEMRELTQQASALTQQTRLNRHSTQGAWLVPAANTPVELKSQAGDVRLSLSQVQADTNGTLALLHIHAVGENSLPAFTAQITWGEMAPGTDQPLQSDRQQQTIHVSNGLLPRRDATVPLRLSNIMPDQLGYVRVHGLLLTDNTQRINLP